MKYLINFILALATASAFNILPEGGELKQRALFVPFNEAGNEGRIVNGKPAGPTQFPWQAVLWIGSSSFCGGVLISSREVLTAAHCADSNALITVQLDGTNLNNLKVERRVRKKKVHPQWNSRTLQYDIALLEIDSVPFSSTIQPLTLPGKSSSYPDYAGDLATASGYGKTNDTSSISQTLQYVVLEVITNDEATKAYPSVITPSIICTSTANSTATCNGDSGGPLVFENTLIGLVSFGSVAGCTKGPSCYTRVTSHLDWILKNME